MPKKKKAEEESYNFKSLLADIANLTAGKGSFKFKFMLSAAQNFLANSKVDQKAAQWVIKTALTNPNLAKSLFYVRSLVNDQNAEFLANTAITFMIPSENDIARLVGVISIGIVHRKFPLEGDLLEQTKSALKKLMLDSDSKVKDATTVILEFLGDSLVDKNDASEALNRLMKDGVDINDALSEED